jgi:hypothetical protein
MTIRKRGLPYIVLPLILIGLSKSVYSGPMINVNIQTILASHKPGPVDPSLQGLAQQLQSVFKYSSYKLLSQNSLTLNRKPSGRVQLPGRRYMVVRSQGISGKRVTLELAIFKRKRQIFQTVVQLRNRSSVTIGGPKHKNGDLFFNIFASF